MWRILLFSILVASTHSALDTPLCPVGGEPVCAKSGFEFIYFENECKLNVFSYKELFAGRPRPTKVSLVECFSNCAGIACPALFQPVCAQQVPGGSVKTVSNACLVNQLICETRQQWVIIANGVCPVTSEPQQGLFATFGIDAVPPLAPYSPVPALATAPTPSYEPKTAYGTIAAPTATYYPPPATAVPDESAPASNYKPPASQAIAADYSALPPASVPTPASYAAPAQDAYTASSQNLPAVPPPYSPPAAPDSYPSPGTSAYLASDVDPAPFAYPPTEYVADPKPVPPPSACQAAYNQEAAPKYASIPEVESYAAASPALPPSDYVAPAPVPVPATYEPAPLPCSASETAPAPAPSPYQDSYQPSPAVYDSPAATAPSPIPYSAPAPVSYGSPNLYSAETPSSCSSSNQYPAPPADPATDSYSAPSQPAESYPDPNLYPAVVASTQYSAPAPSPCSTPDQYTSPDSSPYAPSDQNSVSAPDSYSYLNPAQYQAPATDRSVYSDPTLATSPSVDPYSAQYPFPGSVNLPAQMDYAPAPTSACSSSRPQSTIASLKYDIPAIIGAPQEISGEYVPDLAALISKWIDNNPLISKYGLHSIAPFYYQPTYTLIEYKGSKGPGSY